MKLPISPSLLSGPIQTNESLIIYFMFLTKSNNGNAPSSHSPHLSVYCPRYRLMGQSTLTAPLFPSCSRLEVASSHLYQRLSFGEFCFTATVLQ